MRFGERLAAVQTVGRRADRRHDRAGDVDQRRRGELSVLRALAWMVRERYSSAGESSPRRSASRSGALGPGPQREQPLRLKAVGRVARLAGPRREVRALRLQHRRTGSAVEGDKGDRERDGEEERGGSEEPRLERRRPSVAPGRSQRGRAARTCRLRSADSLRTGCGMRPNLAHPPCKRPATFAGGDRVTDTCRARQRWAFPSRDRRASSASPSKSRYAARCAVTSAWS